MQSCARRLGALLLWSILTVPATAQDVDPGAERAPAGELIDPDNDALVDAAIAERIRAIYAELDGLERVRVRVRAGIVRLTGEAADADAIERAEAIAARLRGVVQVQSKITPPADVSERVSPVLDRISNRARELAAALPMFGLGLLVFALFAGVGWWVTRYERPWHLISKNLFLQQIAQQVVRLAFIVVGGLLALDLAGATALLGTLMGTVGLAGLAIGFAVRDTVENYIASILLSIRQPFRPGDFVEIEQHAGHVIRLTSRATVLLSPDGNHVRIPNSTVFKSIIVNFTRDPHRRMAVNFDIDPASDLAGAQTTMVSSVQPLEAVLAQPPVTTLIDSVNETRARLTLLAWVDQTEHDFSLAQSQAIAAAYSGLDHAGIPLASEQRRMVSRIAKAGAPKAAHAASQPAPPSAQDAPTVDNPAVDRVGRDRALREGRSPEAENLLTNESMPPLD